MTDRSGGQRRTICTERLWIVPATAETTRAALAGRDALAEALGARVPDTWPPEFLDEAALRFTLERFGEGPEQADWWMHFVVRVGEDVEPALIGTGGYKGPPSDDGTVEIGYGIVSDSRRQGYASEVTRGLLQKAFAVPSVRRVIGETLPELAASIGVMRKAGFRLIDECSEPGVIRFELTRVEYDERYAGGRDRSVKD